MKSAAIAQIRTPTEDELNELRNLWTALRQQRLPASTSLSEELRSYLRHAVHMVGLIAGLQTTTGQELWDNNAPLSVSVDGVARLRDSVRLLSLALSLWSRTDAAHEAEQSQ